MSTVTTGLYEEDLTGTLPANLIPAERHTLVTPGKDDFYFIIPQAAPFFVDSVEIVLEATGATLVPGTDYQIGHKFIEAMSSIGRPIAGSIRIMKRSIQGIIRIKYRTIGGVWGFSEAAIIAELGRKQYNPLIRTWGAIDVLPYSFPALDHAQPIDTGLVGSEQLLAGLTRIADVLEATAEGTTQSHLVDYLNPHRTTKAQVNLGNVPNYAMATNTEATAATRADAFMSPAGVLLAINQHAITKLNAHINDKANPHELRAVHVGLDRVPNYPAATDAQALDITNNSVLMTPYTVGLLLAAQSESANLTALENRLNAHINDRANPHQTTPGQLAGGGAYTKAEIDAKLENVSATDTPRFAGLTDAEWRASLPSFDDLDFLCTEMTAAFQQAEQVISQLNPSDPVTPAEQAEREMKRIQAVWAAFSMYSAYNGLWDSVLVTSTDLTQFPTSLPSALNKVAQLQNAGYYVDANGAIVAFGSAAVPTPAGMSPGAGFNSALAASAIYATKDAVWVELDDGIVTDGGFPGGGSIVRYTSAGRVTLYNASADIQAVYTGTGFKYPAELVVVEKPDGSYAGHGEPNWITSINATTAAITSSDSAITDIKIGDDYVLFLTENGNAYVYEIRRTPTITLVAQTALTARNTRTGSSATVRSLTNVIKIAGSYGHFGLIVSSGNAADGELLPYGDLWMFGPENTYDQQAIPPKSGPFLDVSCGYRFTATVSASNVVQFWGNSPDNALLFKNRSIP